MLEWTEFTRVNKGFLLPLFFGLHRFRLLQTDSHRLAEISLRSAEMEAIGWPSPFLAAAHFLSYPDSSILIFFGWPLLLPVGPFFLYLILSRGLYLYFGCLLFRVRVSFDLFSRDLIQSWNRGHPSDRNLLRRGKLHPPDH